MAGLNLNLNLKMTVQQKIIVEQVEERYVNGVFTYRSNARILE